MSTAPRQKPSKTASSPRRRAREFALQGLYQRLLGNDDEASIESQPREARDFDKADGAFFTALLRGVFSQRATLEDMLKTYLDRPYKELSPVEAAVLLIGAFELANYPQTPYRVIINEAIELAKNFGGTDGHKYVNGVLDKLAFRLRPAEAAAKRASSRSP
ncbi:MAG: transcription antitermination factor NusB [Candidatus Accumulibacter sp.]|jgi:N utilization substance protein B|nr:transcription antitermination factor NusB [Accumulibacter sp.]